MSHLSLQTQSVFFSFPDNCTLPVLLWRRVKHVKAAAIYWFRWLIPHACLSACHVGHTCTCHIRCWAHSVSGIINWSWIQMKKKNFFILKKHHGNRETDRERIQGKNTHQLDYWLKARDGVGRERPHCHWCSVSLTQTRGELTQQRAPCISDLFNPLVKAF